MFLSMATILLGDHKHWFNVHAPYIMWVHQFNLLVTVADKQWEFDNIMLGGRCGDGWGHKFVFTHNVLWTRQGRPGIRGTQVKSSIRMKKTQYSSKWLFLGNLIPEIESKAPKIGGFFYWSHFIHDILDGWFYLSATNPQPAGTGPC